MRTARKKCESDVYHVVVRGVGKQILFEDDTDRRFFLDTLADQRAGHGVRLYAWCLMLNHVHLLFRAPLENISAMMRALETRYAGYFNARHARTGTLFQGRFTSVPVESDEQLLQAVRYIHRNPVGAGEPIDGPWSSFRDYVSNCGLIDVDTAFVVELLGGKPAFLRLHDSEDGSYARRLPRHRVADAQALSIAKDVLGEDGPYGLKAIDKASRDALLVRLKEAGLSVRQISRITSIGENIIQRAK